MHFRSYFLLVLLSGAAASSARAQTSSPAPAPTPGAAAAPSSNPPSTDNAGTPPDNAAPITIDKIVVTDTLDQARQDIVPSLGATSFEIDTAQIAAMSQGANAPFNQVLLRAPGIAEDSAANGDLHIRGEHANMQYRINDVVLPEGITGFGLELDPHFVNSMQVITGSLPAQYGFRTAGIVDIQTKGGAMAQTDETSVYGGSFDTVRTTFESTGSGAASGYFLDGSFEHNGIGIENPTPGSKAVHDTTDQGKMFLYSSWILNQSSRVSLMLSGSDSNYQVPDTPGLPAGTAPDGNPWLPGSFDSSRLDENQNEQNYFAVVTYQKSAGDLNYQLSGFGRASSVHFTPDPVGDLYFNGVASDVDRKLYSAGLQGDASYALTDGHTLRSGLMLIDEAVAADSTTTVFPVDANGDPTGPAFPIVDDERLHGLFAGVYAQDEWKIGSRLTVNYGARFDLFDSSFDHESQLSPRLNFIYQATDATTLHAGYSRYFTPPPVENVSGGTVAKFNGTSNASATDQDDPVKAERSNYFDAGITHKFGPRFQAGVDGYYKRAKNQLDDGLFGQTLILSAFNYAEGEVYGVELTSSYTDGGFSAYANLARSSAKGKDWSSAEFLFDPNDLAYVQNHWIFLDHDQTLTGSFGTSYHWTESHGGTRVNLDLLYGSGLRNDATAPDGTNIPNGGAVPSYYTVNVGGEQSIKVEKGREWKLRLDVVNLADRSYELRNGTGVGVNAAQYGMRRGIFGSASYAF